MDNKSTDETKKMREEKELVDLISQLPKAKGWFKNGVALYQGYWWRESAVPSVIKFQKHFQANDTDIIFASNPKSGTTWMKALLFSILNRDRYTPSNTPLLSSSPHDLVPSFEVSLFSARPSHDLTRIRAPRLVSTHIPYGCWPESIQASKSRAVYICRNPLDTIVSFWHFVGHGHEDYLGPGWTLEDCVETFCEGQSVCGPYWDHVLGFWNASLENPEKVLFLNYEDLLEDAASNVKRVARFLGFPFSEEEEKLGVVEGIVELCSIENLRGLEVNQPDKLSLNHSVGNNAFFRNGKVGDWVNHLTPSIVEKVKEVIQEKLHGSGLAFKYKI